jgi:hypothetical protein
MNFRRLYLKNLCLALLWNALKWYLCAQFLIYGPVAQLNRATAF